MKHIIKTIIKVIFLDIDGVLNSYDWRHKSDLPLDEKAVKLLAKIVEKTEAKIVVSSSWRVSIGDEKWHILLDMFNKFGIDIFDITVPLYRPKRLERGWEIRNWLKENKKKYDIESFVILDDDHKEIINHKKILSPYYVKISFKDGLNERHVPKILRVLNGDRLDLSQISKWHHPEWKSDRIWWNKFIQEKIEN